jgi:hypothetical protein
MNHQLTFSELLSYDPGKPGITVPTVLRLKDQEVSLDAKLDTGASHCIFQRGYGERLGLEIEGGWRISISTATGSFNAFGHEITLWGQNFSFELVVYFAEDYAFSRNVLGRHGFLNLVRLGLIDYDGKLYLSRYGDNANGEA